MDDIKFIRDDTEQKKVEALQKILRVLDKKPEEIRVEAAARFLLNVIRASPKLAEEMRKKEAAKKEVKKEVSFSEVIKKLTQPKIPEMEEIPVPLPPKLQVTPKFEMPKEKTEEKLKTEDAIESLKGEYPKSIYKNNKEETIVQLNIAHKDSKVVCRLTEPEIDLRVVEETKNLIKKKFDKDKKVLKDEKFITKNIKKAFKKLKIDYTEEYKEEVKYFLYRNLIGLGQVDPFLHDANIKTVICDGLNKPVKITFGPGMEAETNIIYTKKEELDDQIKHLGKQIKNEASETNPMIEGMFYTFKVQATLGIGEVESKFVIKRMA